MLSLLLLTACGSAPAVTPGEGLPESCPAGLPHTGEPPMLPADRGVGRAALLYQLRYDGPSWLVTSTGERYTLPPTPPGPVPTPQPDASELPEPLPPPPPPEESVRDVRLSPDGRWLVRQSRGRAELRDLTGTRAEGLPFFRALTWSPDGRWLVLQLEDTDPARAYGEVEKSYLSLLRLDLRDGRAEKRRQPVPNMTWRLLGVRDDGTIALNGSHELSGGGPEQNPSGVDESYLVLAFDGRELHRGTLAGRHHLALLVGDLLIGARYPDQGTDAAATIAVDLMTGEPRWTVTHPPHRLGLSYGIAGQLNGTPLIMQDFQRGSPELADTIEIYTVHPATGHTALACRIPARSQVALPR